MNDLAISKERHKSNNLDILNQFMIYIVLYKRYYRNSTIFHKKGGFKRGGPDSVICVRIQSVLLV